MNFAFPKSALSRTCLQVGVASFVGIALQLVHTRVLSSLYFNHVVYLTMTVALLGYGVAASWVSMATRFPGKVDFLFDLGIKLLPLLIPLSGILLSYSSVWLESYPPTLAFVVCYLTLIPVFGCCGLVIAAGFFKNPSGVGKLYFADLLAGAAAIAWFCLGGFGYLGAENSLWFLTALSLTAVFVSLRNLFSTGIQLVAVLILFVSFRGTLINSDPSMLKMGGGRMGRSDIQVERTVWTPITKLDVLRGSYERNIDFGKRIAQDRDAHTVMLSPKTFESRMQRQNLEEAIHPTELSYLIRPKPQDVLVIAAGGGPDIVSALSAGAGHVTAVEINPATVSLLKGPYREYAQWPSNPKVRLVNDDGRHFVATDKQAYDVITMSGADTFAALNSGAYVLTENYLYTLEAGREYLRHLKPGGVMMVFRWLFKAPRETLRLSQIFRQAMQEQGIAHPEKRVLIIASDYSWPTWWVSYLVKNGDFTPEEVKHVLAVMKNPDLPYPMYAAYLPKVFPAVEQERVEKEEFAKGVSYLRVAQASYQSIWNPDDAKVKAFVKEYRYDVSMTTDDKPFFFEFEKPFRFTDSFLPGEIDQLRSYIGHSALGFLLVVALGVTFICIFLPLWVFERHGLSSSGSANWMGYFALVGAGFFMGEISLIQRFCVYLGNPIYAFCCVAGGILLFAGFGGFCSRQFENVSLSYLPAFAGLGMGSLWLLSYPLNSWAIGWEMKYRVLVLMLAVAPAGFLLGFPFPSALRALSKIRPQLMPWAYGINGVCGVVGSILAILVALHFGFRVVFFLSLGCYTLAALIVARQTDENSELERKRNSFSARQGFFELVQRLGRRCGLPSRS